MMVGKVCMTRHLLGRVSCGEFWGALLILTVTALLFIACSSHRNAEQDAGAQVPDAAVSQKSSTKSVGLLLDGHHPTNRELKRDLVAVEWRHPLKTALNRVVVTPERHVIAIGTSQMTVLDARGRHLWHRNIAPGDELYPSGSCLFMRLATGHTLTALDERGGFRWERELDGALFPLDDGTILVADAATIRALACRNGRENWMFSPDHIRSLRLVGMTKESFAVLGELGHKRVLFKLDRRGKLLRKIHLPPSITYAEILEGAGILTRSAKRLTIIDEEGGTVWSGPLTTRTEVSTYRGDIVLANGSPDGRVTVRAFSPRGEETHICTVPVKAEPVSIRILSSPRYPLMLAACAGALSSCAESGLSTGPYNRLWACMWPENNVIGLVDQSSELYFDMAQTEESMVVVATSPNGRETHVIQLSPDLESKRLVRIPGRRMLGPIEGPNGQWLVGTCHGLRCGAPWALHAVASQEE